MGSIDHFSNGLLTPAVAYLMSCIGSALGLLCAIRARAVTGAPRVRWFALASVSIGGTGIWGMHFVGMLGFSVTDTPIRYDATRTVVSLLLAIAVVGVGMAIIGRRGSRTTGLIVGGIVTGSGVAIMHYVGMSAMSINDDIGYDTFRVALSVLIALVASTAALWAALNVKGVVAVTGASLIMGIAVSGMHYTGMSAMTLESNTHTSALHGVEASQFLAPLVVGVSLFTVITLFIVALSSSTGELREEAELGARLERLAQRRTDGVAFTDPGRGGPQQPGEPRRPEPDYFRAP